jgi:hypothetical protein
MLSAFMMSYILLNVVILRVVMQSVLAPFSALDCKHTYAAVTGDYALCK